MDIPLLKSVTKGITLLYVEDELRYSVERYLKKFFDHVLIASNGQEGLKLYQKEQYDIVITEVMHA